MHLNLTRKTGYVVLFLSILFEQCGTGMIQASQGYTHLLPTIGAIVSYSICYILFSNALEYINLSISSATWSAVGTVGSALMGIYLFSQSLSIWGWIGIAVIIVGIFLLNMYGDAGSDDAGDDNTPLHAPAGAPGNKALTAPAPGKEADK